MLLADTGDEADILCFGGPSMSPMSELSDALFKYTECCWKRTASCHLAVRAWSGETGAELLQVANLTPEEAVRFCFLDGADSPNSNPADQVPGRQIWEELVASKARIFVLLCCCPEVDVADYAGGSLSELLRRALAKSTSISPRTARLMIEWKLGRSL